MLNKDLLNLEPPLDNPGYAPGSTRLHVQSIYIFLPQFSLHQSLLSRRVRGTSWKQEMRSREYFYRY